MTTPPISAPYKQTVGALAEAMSGFQHVAKGDPRKVAGLVLNVAELDDPPLRLLAGSDAYNFAHQAWQSRLQTDADWQQLSESTDFDATAAGESP